MGSPAIDYGAHVPDAGAIDYGAHVTDQAPKSFTDQLGDFAGHTWEALKGTVTGPVSAAIHPIDTVSNILSDASAEVKKGKEAFDKGDYDRAAEHFKYALPVAGPLLRTMREETDAGQYGAALGDITGTVLGGKALAAIPHLPSTGKVAGKLLDVVPEAVGDPALQNGAGVISTPRLGNLMKVMDRAKKARAAYQEASGAESSIPPEILSRMGMTEADFKLLPKDAQASVSDLATRMQTASPSKPPPVFDRTGRVPTGNEPQEPAGDPS